MDFIKLIRSKLWESLKITLALIFAPFTLFFFILVFSVRLFQVPFVTKFLQKTPLGYIFELSGLGKSWKKLFDSYADQSDKDIIWEYHTDNTFLTIEERHEFFENSQDDPYAKEILKKMRKL